MASLGLALGFILQIGCASQPGAYIETYEIDRLTVVFLDEASLHHEWQRRAHSQPVRFVSGAIPGQPSLRVVRGFYDDRTKTIYCLKWDFQVCGHELHHAVLGNFHHDHSTAPR